MQQKMSDPANCMDGCDWVEGAVAVHTKGLAAVDFELLKKLTLAEEANADLAARLDATIENGRNGRD